MEYSVYSCELPKRSEDLNEYIDLLYPEYEIHSEVSNLIFKYTFLILLNKSDFPKPSKDVIELCKNESEKIRSNEWDGFKVIDDETTEMIVQVIFDSAKIHDKKKVYRENKLSDKDIEKEVISLISFDVYWKMREFFEKELIPYLTKNSEVIQVVNDIVTIDDKLYIISTSNNINDVIDKIVKDANINHYYILNVINNEMNELKFTQDELDILIDEEKQTIKIEKFGNLSKFKLTTSYLEVIKSGDSSFLSRVIYKLLQYDNKLTFGKTKYRDNLFYSYFKYIDFESIKKVINYAKDHSTTFDIDYIIEEAKIRNNDGRRFIELAVLKNIERRRKHLPIIKWKLTTDDLYDYCFESRRDQFSDSCEDPLEFYIDNYSGFDLTNVNDEEFDSRCKYVLDELESCNSDVRRAATATSEEIIGLTRTLRYSSDKEHDLVFEQEFLRLMIVENQKRIKIATKMLNEAKETSKMIINAMK